MNWTDLAGPLIRLGAPTIGGALGGPLGASIGKTVGNIFADALGTAETPEAVLAGIEANPSVVQRVEEHHSEAVLLAAQANQAALFKREDTRGPFYNAWRPALSWLLIFLWLWNAMLVHVVNAFGAGVVVIPWDQLVALSGLWLAIYGGGHTAKEIWGK